MVTKLFDWSIETSEFLQKKESIENLFSPFFSKNFCLKCKIDDEWSEEIKNHAELFSFLKELNPYAMSIFANDFSIIKSVMFSPEFIFGKDIHFYFYQKENSDLEKLQLKDL